MAVAYPSYRASGTPWAARVPEHWRTARLRYVARVGNGTTPARDRFDYWSNGSVPWLASGQVNDYIVRKAREHITPVALKESSLRLLPAGSVILGMVGQGKTRGMSAYLGIEATINQNLAGVTPGRELDGRYLHYTLIAAYDFLRNYGRGGNQAALNCAIVGSFTTLLPPRPEQDQIVAYLRAQDAHIARFIKAKRDLIGLLTEQKLRIIDHAVTRGLDANIRLKPSGIEWLGEVPAHWEVQRLKNIADVVLGKMLTTEAKGDNGEFKPYLRSTNVQWLKPDVLDVKEMWIAHAEMPQLRIRKGDLLVSEGGEVGRACIWDEELAECYIQNSVHRVAAKPVVLPEFLLHQFFTYGKRGRFNAIVNRVSIAHLTREKLVTVPFALPPIEEQQAICRWIAEATQPLDEAIARAEDEIKLIREYRDRQIADVVTGQVDLRGWRPGPGDAVSDDDLAALGGDEPEEAETAESEEG
ncbi:restriction endonuclease subunit S [Solimonas variicoloris]|uniref:restriction endonuclease subunit S n=1 Tax=Solimonas variicoloris TaxID=254408 RepID=UPI000584C5FA|nr:restriction endonuclease subunit S [Solimonas variicoloris]